MKLKKWNELELKNAVKKSKSIRQALFLLGLKPAGGNYKQVKQYVKKLKINTDHFLGQGWNRGMKCIGIDRIPLKKILVRNSNFQSYKLKKRLFKSGFKKPFCEECGWAKVSVDGRTPIELDHINGDSKDNRLENLRILCPNCHSLKATHRGRNIKNVN